jgi:hypothetical protein
MPSNGRTLEEEEEEEEEIIRLLGNGSVKIPYCC